MKTNVILQGEIGSGKTRSLITLLPEYVDEDGVVRKGAGQRVGLVSLEPGAEATLEPNLCKHKDDFGIHLVYLQPLAITWDQFGDFMRIINAMPLDDALKKGDPNKRRCTQMLDILSTFAAFTCQRCSAKLGDVAEWSDDSTIALDGLTGLTTMARHLCVGLKPILSQPEYNPVMGAVEGFLQLMFGGTKCNAVLLSHIDREVNPVTGISGITIHTIGQKLAPRITKMPDELLMAQEHNGIYTWSNDNPGQITKRRALPLSSELRPDFSQLFTPSA